MFIFIIFSFFTRKKIKTHSKYWLHVQSGGSSVESPQSFTLSQNLVFEMHRPFLHFNSSIAHPFFCPQSSIFSSLPSMQSTILSQTRFCNRHSPNGHRWPEQSGNSFILAQNGQSKEKRNENKNKINLSRKFHFFPCPIACLCQGRKFLNFQLRWNFRENKGHSCYETSMLDNKRCFLLIDIQTRHILMHLMRKYWHKIN